MDTLRLLLKESNPTTCQQQQPNKLEKSTYSPSVLVGNWYEDRRRYTRQLLCPRFTGRTVSSTSYLPTCTRGSKLTQQNYKNNNPLILDREESYLQNYTTTYDLIHNWELRRAGLLPGGWAPQKFHRDNAKCYGNLSQLGYRLAPQLPQLPTDWDLYENNPSGYFIDFPTYPPDAYGNCRKAVLVRHIPQSFKPGTQTLHHPDQPWAYRAFKRRVPRDTAEINV